MACIRCVEGILLEISKTVEEYNLRLALPLALGKQELPYLSSGELQWGNMAEEGMRRVGTCGVAEVRNFFHRRALLYADIRHMPAVFAYSGKRLVGHCIANVIEGELAGCCAFKVFRYVDGLVVFISKFATDPSRRQRGISARLLKSMFSVLPPAPNVVVVLQSVWGQL